MTHDVKVKVDDLTAYLTNIRLRGRELAKQDQYAASDRNDERQNTQKDHNAPPVFNRTSNVLEVVTGSLTSPADGLGKDHWRKSATVPPSAGHDAGGIGRRSSLGRAPNRKNRTGTELS